VSRAWLRVFRSGKDYFAERLSSVDKYRLTEASLERMRGRIMMLEIPEAAIIYGYQEQVTVTMDESSSAGISTDDPSPKNILSNHPE